MSSGGKKLCTQDLSTASSSSGSHVTEPRAAATAAIAPMATKPPSEFMRKIKLKPFVFSGSFATNPLAVQSPTTALSRLSFGTVSPVVEEPRTPATPSTPVTATPERHDAPAPFPLVPTTSLHALSSIPCFAGSGSDVSATATAQPQHSTNNNKPAPSAKSPMTGSKRPLTSSLDLDLTHTQVTEQSPSSAHCPGGGHCGVTDDVKMRSPELRAKRPLVRPNSIAFSSYPLADFPGGPGDAGASPTRRHECSESSQTVVAALPPPTSPVAAAAASVQPHYQSAAVETSSNILTSSASATVLSADGSMSTGASASHGVEMRHKSAAATSAAAVRPAGFEQARKSRSLENLLKPDAGSGADATTMAWTQSEDSASKAPKIVNAAELFGQPMALDVVKRQRARVSLRHAEMNQSSSSISSSGSHNSLHGSLEIIQVS